MKKIFEFLGEPYPNRTADQRGKLPSRFMSGLSAILFADFKFFNEATAHGSGLLQPVPAQSVPPPGPPAVSHTPGIASPAPRVLREPAPNSPPSSRTSRSGDSTGRLWTGNFPTLGFLGPVLVRRSSLAVWDLVWGDDRQALHQVHRFSSPRGQTESLAIHPGLFRLRSRRFPDHGRPRRLLYEGAWVRKLPWLTEYGGVAPGVAILALMALMALLVALLSLLLEGKLKRSRCWVWRVGPGSP